MSESHKPGTPPRLGDKVVDACFLAGAKEAGQFPPPTLTEVAFAGRSNVGKSSLMNSLLQRRGLVRTSSTPGCTRQVSWFRVKCDDAAQLDLVDLPGYGYAKRSKTERRAWAGIIEAYLLERPTLRAVAVLIDVRRGLEEDDRDLLELLASPALTSRPPLGLILVATKLDKLSRSAQKPAMAALIQTIGRPVLGYAAPESMGRLPLWRRMRELAGIGVPPDSDSQGTAPR